MGKKLLSLLLFIFILSGCANGQANQRTTRSLTGRVADPHFMEGSMTVLSNDLVGTKQAIAGVIPTAGESQRRKLSEFSTEFDESDKGRSNNIKTASRSIDNIVIYPGETFSYNESVGPTIKRYGYEKATIYDKGTKKKGYGGGVCQVSSTLYNAAEKAGMEIIERHHHSLPVSYVPEGKDAATSYGGIDFKFVNNKSYPVKINSWVSANKLVIYFESA